jgi:hypothetical protein
MANEKLDKVIDTTGQFNNLREIFVTKEDIRKEIFATKEDIRGVIKWIAIMLIGQTVILVLVMKLWTK